MQEMIYSLYLSRITESRQLLVSNISCMVYMIEII